VIYSCFNPQSGFYDYFESSDQIPINADLPVPKLPPAGNDIGVSSMEAGRPMPSDAKRIGSGWHARGLVANCGRGGGGLGDSSSAMNRGLLVLAACAAATYYLLRDKLRFG
jgi:hypothetical protein